MTVPKRLRADGKRRKLVKLRQGAYGSEPYKRPVACMLPAELLDFATQQHRSLFHNC